jgi:hypothetical protein
MGACLVAGPALWLSRAVFDRIGTGAGMRVAFLPSWPELVGLTVFASLAVLIGHAAIEHRIGHERSARLVAARVLTPLFILPCLALPYVPWLADAVPAVDALAGPGRWWVWGVVAAQVAWEIVRATRPAEPVAHRRWHAMAIWAISASLFLLCAWTLERGPVYPGGDEPHYLVITQSVLHDRDLAIANNHAQGDYRAYNRSDLKPDYRVTGRDGVIYSIHPIGIAMLVAPAFALAGYAGAMITVVLLAASAVTLLWLWGRQVTGSTGAATVGWLAIATSAPFVLHSFSIYPECAAALAVMVVVAWRPDDQQPGIAIGRSVALGALPWLSTKYVPMSAVLLLLVVVRHWARRTDAHAAGARGSTIVATMAPYAASCLAWIAWFWWLWGVPSPTAPYGSAHQMSLENLKAGFPGLFFDQEYGTVAVAPALALASVAWWRLWRRGIDGRWLVAVTAAPLLTLAATTGAFALWWGGSAPPGRELVAALPLVGVPLAWLWQDTAARSVQRAALEWLVLVGIVTTATLVLVHGGLLMANERDGTSALLEYLDHTRQLSRDVPSFILGRFQIATPIFVSAVWIALAIAAWHLGRGLRVQRPSSAALTASVLGLGAMIVVAAAVPRLFGAGLPPPSPVESRVETPALWGFDTTARPLGVQLSDWRITEPLEIVQAVRFEATPGLRRGTQPIRVMFNARLALPAGTYAVQLHPVNGASLDGQLGLQIGRLGAPVVVWPISSAAGAPWTTTFTLDVDANFVGFRASPALEASTARLEVAPISVVNAGDRFSRPPVMAAARYGNVPVYFHDDRAYPEADGFWLRGRTTSEMTIGLPDGADQPSLRLQLHAGDRSTPVDIATPAWSTRVTLSPGKTTDLIVPARAGQQLLAVRITPEDGFVPAEHGGASNDRRLLGCWIAVAH